MINIFGTAGIRAQVGQSPLTLSEIIKLGQAVGQFIINKHGIHAKVLIANDTRVSSDWIKATFKAGLLQFPVLVEDGQILSTPAIYNLITNQKLYQYGIMITASHNPYQDNGIKLISQEDGNLTLAEELQITELFYAPSPTPDCTNLGRETNQYKSSSNSAAQAYLKFMTALIKFKQPLNELIIWDCANGATSDLVPQVLNHLGANYLIINHQPTGQNINHNCGSTHPESLQATVQTHSARLGFALDGDGDRITVVTADRKVKDGDDLIAFLSTNSEYQTETNLVGTIISNYGLELWLQAQNKKLIRSNVGEKYISQELLANQSQIGGEPSGHIILRNLANSSDGLLVALKILETAYLTNNWSLQTFTRTPTINADIAIKNKLNLSNRPFIDLINNYQKLITPGRLVIRYSGTENYLRILLEGSDSEQLQRVLTQIKTELVPLLS